MRAFSPLHMSLPQVLQKIVRSRTVIAGLKSFNLLVMSSGSPLIAVSIVGCTSAAEAPPSPETPRPGDESAVEEDSSDVQNAVTDEELALELPTEIERIDVDRFLRSRRTLYVRYLPLDPKFAEIHRTFGHLLIRDRESDRSLTAQLTEDLSRTHWLYLFGILELQEKMTDTSTALLLEEQKATLAHYLRTLTFMAKVLDREWETDAYQTYLKRVYKTLADRHLYRKLKERVPKERKPMGRKIEQERPPTERTPKAGSNSP